MNNERKQQIIIDPYIGPRPFKQDIEDQKRFFGRDDETDEIVSLILGHKLVLIYAQSGAGKTSIFNAKVAPTLEKYGFQVLPTARVGIASDTKSEFDPLVMNIKISSSSSSSSVAEVINSYMLNALQSLRPEIDSKLLFLNRRLSSFLEEYFPITNDNNKNNKIKAQVLVFDELEELFNFYPGTTWRKQQEDFFEQITEALEENPLLRIVFVIREDYLAELDHFAGILPGRLRARFRLERLGKDSALLAIKGPLKDLSNSTLKNYSEQEIDIQIEMLVEELLKIQVEDPFTGKPHQIDGDFVEPIHLQIVCQRWWKEISLGKPQSAQSRLKALADVDSALQEFYERSIYDATTHTNVSEGIVRRLCEEKLITSSGTRAFVHRGAFAQFIQGINKSISEEKIDKVIRILESKYLIRADRRSGAKWYEITHDRLIGPIKASNLKWKEYDRNRKSRRHRMIIMPSIAIVAIAVSMIVFFFFNPFTHSEAILLGQIPSEISINPQTNMICVTGSNYVSVIEGKTKTMVADIPVEKNIIDLSVNQQTNRIYAVGISYSSSSSDSLYVIDGKTNKVVDDIILLNKSRSYISINPQTNKIYAVGINSSSGSDSVSVIDGKTNKVVDDITLDQPVYEISINPQTNMIYAAGSDSLYVIDGKTKTMVADISVDKNIIDLSINPQTNRIYVSDFDSNAVYIINGMANRIEASIAGPEPPGIKVGKEPSDISINPQTNMIYVDNLKSDSLSVIDGKTNKVVDDIRIKKPSGISTNPQTNMIYAVGINSSSVSDYVSVIDGKTNKVVDDITLGQSTPEVLGQPAYEIFINPQTNMIYVLGYSSVSVIDGKTNKVVDDITLGQPASGISINPQTNMIYVLGYSSVSVIDGKTNKVVDDITLGQQASDISTNPQTNMIYVAGANYNPSTGITSGSVSVIDGKTNKVVDDIPLIHVRSSDYIDANPKTNIVYVVSAASDSITPINATTNQIQ